MQRLGRAALCAALAVLVVGVGDARAATPVPGFAEREIASGFDWAVGMDFAPDGRLFVVEKKGRLHVVHPDGSRKLVLDISGHVQDYADRGLTGVAVDSSFETNRYVYLAYTYDRTGRNVTGPKTARVTRIQVNPDDTVANPSSPETVIVGTYTPTQLSEACPPPSNLVDCIPADGASHVQGTVRSAPDGTLFIGTGDAAFQATNSPDPFRPLNEQSFAGKILHVDRNGRGLPGHKFCPTTKNLTYACTKVYAKGFRNPFRFDFASRGGLYVGDVGQLRWEELDHVHRGASYGWPCYEASERYSPRASSTQCQQVYAKEGTAAAQKRPIFVYPHNGAGAVILGGPEYQGTAYPEEIRGSVFFGDIDRGFLDRLVLDAEGQVAARKHVADEYLGVDMRVSPDGVLCTVNFFNVTCLEPADGNRAPRASVVASPESGPLPLEVTFDGSGSSDPDGDELTHTWTFGDDTDPVSAERATHTYTTAGSYTATLTVTDEHGLVDRADIAIRAGVNPPALDVRAPATYRNGTPVTLSATASDVEDGNLSAAVRWTVELHHNEHVHAVTETSGSSVTFTPFRDHDADSHYEAVAHVVDSDGLDVRRRVRLDPEIVDVTLETDPPGITGEVGYGAGLFPWPYSTRSVIGFETTVVAQPTATKDGLTYTFKGWSDGGAATHDVTVPAGGLHLVAQYAQDSQPPETTLVAPQATYRTQTPTFRFVADEPTHGFQCRIDDNGWQWCNSPWKSYAVRYGVHTVHVRAYDLVGNFDRTPASHTFTVVP